jgi:hypothetical protein
LNAIDVPGYGARIVLLAIVGRTRMQERIAQVAPITASKQGVVSAPTRRAGLPGPKFASMGFLLCSPRRPAPANQNLLVQSDAPLVAFQVPFGGKESSVL